MAASISALANAVAVGNEAGWLLAFHGETLGAVNVVPDLELGSDDYYAEIHATLPGGLAGGAYSIVVEGMTDGHYAAVRKAKVARLFLYWRDTNQTLLGYLANVTGLASLIAGARSATLSDYLVAELSIDAVMRRTGKRRYEAEITASERAFARLSAARLTSAIEDQPGSALLPALFSALGFASYQTHGTLVKHRFAKGQSGTELLRDYARRLEEGTGKRGRGMLLIRNGTLHVGARPIPFGNRPTIELSASSGLIETSALGTVSADPNHDPPDDAPMRRQFQLLLKGRPDLKPGDVVAFEPPPADGDDGSGVLGDLVAMVYPFDLGGGAKVEMYVESVEHRLGRTSGFATTVTGVTVGEDAWDTYSQLDGSTARTGARSGSATAVGRAAQAVHDAVAHAATERAGTTIGEVRAATTSGTGDPPAQTLRVLEGLAADDGEPHGARRLAVTNPSVNVSAGAPYASPFAWGKCGLVLPRYPGTRVVLTHRDGRRDDPIDIGALWHQSAAGPDSNAGDWWLILPVGIAQSSRGTAADTATLQPHSGKVSQDLIDADGNRIIEVGELTIRVGRSALANAGTRPTRHSDQDCVRIEHTAGGSSITMKPNGEILIVSNNQNLTLDAGSGTIKMIAATVDVAVSNNMNVH